jgi:hypothetical protein
MILRTPQAAIRGRRYEALAPRVGHVMSLVQQDANAYLSSNENVTAYVIVKKIAAY